MSTDQNTEDSHPAGEVDTANDFLVGTSAGDIIFPLPNLLTDRIPAHKALRLAAWIVAMVDISEDHADFLRVLRAVENT